MIEMFSLASANLNGEQCWKYFSGGEYGQQWLPVFCLTHFLRLTYFRLN